MARRAQAATLARLLADWDATLGQVSDEGAASAAAAFDDLDAASTPPNASPARGSL